MPSGCGPRVPACLERHRLVHSSDGPAAGLRRVLQAAAIVLVSVVIAGCSVLPKQYEYEEEIYLSLDGTATVYVNSSIPALVALRGLELDPAPRARLDRAAIRRAYTSPLTTVTRFGTSRRNGRRFVHLRLSVSDIRRLNEVAPFAWSHYAFTQQGDVFVYTQLVGDAARHEVRDVGWKGNELVAFRMHLPSKIRYHDAPSRQVERGNILAWEQPFADRRAGAPVSIEVRLDTQSILYRTLWLFGLMVVLVTVMFVVLIWWIVRKGRGGQPART